MLFLYSGQRGHNPDDVGYELEAWGFRVSDLNKEGLLRDSHIRLIDDVLFAASIDDLVLPLGDAKPTSELCALPLALVA